MRRLLVTVVAVAALFTAAGCSGERPTPAGPDGPGGGPAAGASSSAPPLGPTAGVSASPAGGNAKEVCAAATKSSSDSVRIFVAELGNMLQATSAKDAAAAETAQRKAEAALNSWSSAMREQSARATDPRLKAVLADIAAEVSTMKASVDSVDEVKLDQLQQRLDQLCGN